MTNQEAIIVSRVVSAIEKADNHRIVDGIMLGLNRMRAQTAARKRMRECPFDAQQMTVVKRLFTEEWASILEVGGAYPFNIEQVIFEAYDAYHELDMVAV